MKNLAIKRVSLGLTQLQLSELTGITQENISLYENGKQQPLPDNLFKLSNALGCPVEELF